MIPSLKQTHETKLKKYLIEVKKNPEMLQEAFDENQLDEMHKALKSLTKTFAMDEFKNLTSFHLGLQKAYSNLNDLLSSNRVTRAIKLKGELRDIAGFIDGISKLLRQLPQIVDIAKSSISREGEWNPDESISQIYQNLAQHSKFRQLRTNVLKAMKPGTFKSMPYINDQEAATELLNLSFNQLSKLNDLMNRGKIAQQTVMNQSFTDQLSKILGIGAGGEAPKAPEAPVEKPKAEEKPALELPAPHSAAATPPAVANDKVSARVAAQEIKKIYDQAFLEAFGKKEKLSERETRMRDTIMSGVLQWMLSSGMVTKVTRG